MTNILLQTKKYNKWTQTKSLESHISRILAATAPVIEFEFNHYKTCQIG